MRSVRVAAAAVTLTMLAAAAACSASGDQKIVVQTGGSGSTSAGGSAGGGGSEADSAAGSGGLLVDSGGLNDGAIDPDSACAAEVAEAKPVPVNLYLMLDRSGSMSGSKWSSATSGMSAFVQDPASTGLRVALAYFPSDADDCDPVSYSTPVVGLGELTGDPAPTDAQEKKLVDSLSTTGTTGLTPMFPAFAGTLGYCTSVAKKNPKEKVIAVLLTDGSPVGCDSKTNNVNTIAALAASAYADTPPVVTFTIGFDGSEEAELKQIAQAGGGQAFFLGGSSNVQQDLLQKLKEIAGGELACEYLLPEKGKDGQPTDPTRVNVNYYPSSGSSEELLKVDNEAACVLNGWYYDDPVNPTRIILCPATCTSIQKDAGAKVQILLGCESRVPA